MSPPWGSFARVPSWVAYVRHFLSNEYGNSLPPPLAPAPDRRLACRTAPGAATMMNHASHVSTSAYRHIGRNKARRSEEHTSELQSLMRISYAVFCLKKKTKHNTQ